MRTEGEGRLNFKVFRWVFLRWIRYLSLYAVRYFRFGQRPHHFRESWYQVSKVRYGKVHVFSISGGSVMIELSDDYEKGKRGD